MTKSYKDKLKQKCKYFTGVQNKVCKAGVKYCSVVDGYKEIPCLMRGDSKCEKFENYSESEIEAEIIEQDRITKLLSAELSPCCEEKIDNSHVITSGAYKGHGPRYCSRCKKVVYVV